MHSARHVTCASQEAVHVLRAQGYRGGADIAPMIGCDTGLFFPRTLDEIMRTRAAHGIASAHSLIGFVGRLSPEKSVETLLEAVAGAEERHMLLIVGDGPERAALENRAAELGIAERVRFVGALPLDQIPDVIASLDVLALPSRRTTHWHEQFGRVLVEAMASKVAVVGSNTGAIPGVIGDPTMLFPERDAGALASLLDHLSAQPELRLRAGEDGYARALKHFTMERVCEQLVAVWRGLAAPGVGVKFA
jgi:glycosyltransferase involved in cell wall biosynthesis